MITTCIATTNIFLSIQHSQSKIKKLFKIILSLHLNFQSAFYGMKNADMRSMTTGITFDQKTRTKTSMRKIHEQV